MLDRAGDMQAIWKQKVLLIKMSKLDIELAVALAQVVERSLLTPEIRRANPNIGKILSINSTFK